VKEFSVFVESMRRLYKDEKVTEKKILELFESKKITEEEKWHILNARKGL
jgi:protein gp37